MRALAFGRAPAPVARAARAALASALLAAATFVLTGCAARRDSGVTLRFWAMGREGEVVQELVRDFERTHPGIRVDVQQIPWSAAHEKLLTAHVGRSTPDISQLGNTWISEFQTLRALEPLGPFIVRSAEVARERFFGGIWDTNVIGAEAYGVPWYVDTRVLFYRRDLLARAGYDAMPATWEGWRQAMVAVKRVAGPGSYAVMLPVNEWVPPMVLGLSAGSPILAEGGTRGAFSGPEFRRAFHFFVDLFRDGLAPPIANTEIANLYQDFDRGHFSMYITGPWNLGEFRRRLPAARQDTWCTAPLPGPTGRESGLSMAGGSSLVVFRGSKHKEEAWKLIEFLSHPDRQLAFYRLCGDLPARIEPWSDEALSADPCLAAFGEQLTRVRPLPPVPEMEQIAIRLQDWSERAVRGALPPDTALARLDREVDRMLEKRRWMAAHRKPEAGAP